MKAFSMFMFLLFWYLYVTVESAKLVRSAETTTLVPIDTTSVDLKESPTTESGVNTSTTTVKPGTPESESKTTVIPKISTTQNNQSHKKYTPIAKNTNRPTKITLTKPNSIIPIITLTCPKESEAKFNLFAPPCKSDRDCTAWNKEERCCKLFGSKTCIRGVPKAAEEPKHDAIFGLIPRKCPERPLAELWWDLKTCETDNDCWPRICCPDGQTKYCRASTLEYSSVPFSFGRPIAYLSEYLECTLPPPQVFDLHPKLCNSTLDCFPNVCCQEAGKRHCRPPKKSVLPLMANFLNAGLLRRFTNNLVIR